MNKSKIEEQVLKQKKFIGATATFLTLGSAALLATQGLSALPLLTVSLPLFIDIFTLNELAKKDTHFKTNFYICDPTFKMRMGGWFKKYINQTDDLIEKKYKAIFLHVWVYQKRLKMKDLVSSKFTVFNDLFNELKQKKLTNYSIHLSPQENFIRDIVDFLNEDKSDPKKIATAKKVYEEYQGEGALGRAFLENIQFAGFSYLQEHKFTPEDYKVIEQCNFHRRLDIYEDTVKEIMENILDKEDNLKHLKILDNHCIQILKNKTSLDAGSIINMQKAITNKIEYLELNEELESKDNSSIKLKKMKL